MKKNVFKSVICLLAIAAIASEFSANAQEAKGLTRSVVIVNGDTTVNGKNLSELDKNERAKLRKEFKEMEQNFRGYGRSAKDSEVIVKRRMADGNGEVIIGRNGKEPEVLVWNDDIFETKTPAGLQRFKFEGDSGKNFSRDLKVFRFDSDSSLTFSFNTDSLMKNFHFKMDGLDTNLRKKIITMHRDIAPGRAGLNIRSRELPNMEFERHIFPGFPARNNSSAFNYNYTDNDGISSHMNIRLDDAGREQLKKITGTETIGKPLDVNDLTLFPNFSNGKMTISFNLATKGNARIALLDSELKSVFTDDAANVNGNYVKQLSLPKNGVYYITVNQGGSWFVKRLVKE